MEALGLGSRNWPSPNETIIAGNTAEVKREFTAEYGP